MKINSVVELPEGSVKFDGELTPEETKLVVELGLQFLVRSGAFNVLSAVEASKEVH